MIEQSMIQTQKEAKPIFTQLFGGALQRVAVNNSPIEDAPPIVHEVLRSPGQPLDACTRAFMEPRFGQDFSQVPIYTGKTAALSSPLVIGSPSDRFENEAKTVAQHIMSRSASSNPAKYDFSEVRLHTDRQAAASARSLNAHAYAVANHIVFNTGQYSPQTRTGQELLAHELTHVLQQSTSQIAIRRQPDPAGVLASNEAEQAEENRKDREHFEKMREEHRQKITEMKERERPHALRQARMTAQSAAGGDAARLIQSAMVESRILKPYLQSRWGTDESRGQVRITDGRFTLYDTLDDFAGAWATFTGRPSMRITQALRNEAAGIGGFYDRKTKRIHLNHGATLGTALHESVHKISNLAIKSLFSDFLYEGTTQYFADAILNEHGLAASTGHRYGAQLNCARAFISLFGQDDVARLQFGRKGAEDLVKRVEQQLNISSAERTRLAQHDQLCQRIMGAAVSSQAPGPAGPRPNLPPQASTPGRRNYE